jgi:hypothetical protein
VGPGRHYSTLAIRGGEPSFRQIATRVMHDGQNGP